jgi:DNA polymerase-3 subunit beta
MHFQAENTGLVSGIRLVERAVSSSNTLQILGGIHLQADKNSLTLTANDLEISIQTKIECTTFTPGSAVLNGKLLSALVRKLPQGTVIFETKDNQVLISAGTTEFSLNELVGDEFPAPPKCDRKILSLTDYELSKLAHSTLFCVGTDDHRPIFQGVLLEISNGSLHFVATDSSRLAFAKGEVPFVAAEDLEVIIPGRSLTELLKCLPMDESVIDVYYGENQLAFHFNNTVFTTRLIEGKFPNYRPILYTEQEITLTMSRQHFLQAVERAALFDRTGNQPVIVQVTDGVLELGIQTELGRSMEQLNVEHSGSNGQSAYSPRFIMDMLKWTDADQVTFKFEQGPRQALIKPADRDDHLYILMPIRI